MSFTDAQTRALSAPLDRNNVKARTQAGRQLSYVEAWKAIDEANRIFGFDGWARETVDLRQLGEPRKVGETMRVGYSCRVRITVYAGDRMIVREGCGFGQGIDRDADQAHESALKEAESDAMKRALMTFGNPFGLALYDKSHSNVVDGPPAEDSAVVAAAQVAIGLCKNTADLDAWYAANKAMIDGLPKAEIKAIVDVFQARLAEVKPRQVA